ncbi:MAG TPA: hypothetical protein VHL58_13615 [Thermoanaerobaculia bacterium]|nr:hypothetical protein [Thermoanaerobaculia bacterium]
MRCFVTSLLFIVGSTVVAAEVPQQLPKTTVAVFKNGYAFFTRQGVVTVTEGWGVLRDLPPASHGTLWLSADGQPVDESVVSKRDVATPRNATSITELLSANVGRSVTVTVRDKEYSGTIVEPARSVGSPATTDTSRAEPLLILEGGGKTMAFPRGDVTAISFSGKPATSLDGMVEEKSLRFRARGDRVAVSLSYLREGLSWAPQYLVTLENDSTARLSMTALLVNDAEILGDADVYFVVGFPNFAFSTVQSPLGLQQSLAQFLAALSGGRERTYNTMSNMSNVMTQSSMINVGESGAATGLTNDDVKGTIEEDLFLYSRSHVTLSRGERAQYQIFSATVPYQHLYKTEIGDTSGADWNGRSVDPRERETASQVWHSLRLKNNTRLPWTTAPAIAMAASRPLAQETLHYTPADGATDLKLTIAPDVEVQPGEVETSRQRVTIASDNYIAVTVKGTIVLRNYKRKQVTLSIEKLLTGETLSQSNEGKSVALATHLSAVNPSIRLTWEIPLAAGARETVTYTYKVLFRT